MANDQKQVQNDSTISSAAQSATVTAPSPHAGPMCHYHKDEKAVSKCTRCGKYICRDCFDTYRVTGGAYAGKALCYDCCQKMVEDNVELLKKNRIQIGIQFAIMIAGMILGAIVAAEGDNGIGSILLGMAVGGVLLSAVKLFASSLWEAFKLMFSGNMDNIVSSIIYMIGQIIIILCKSVVGSITKIVQYTTYLIHTSKCIDSDDKCLQQMSDYMEYTLVRNQNKEIDLETFMKGESKLADNSYAHMVRSQGEEQAEESIRQCVTTISENGEIIRNFDHKADTQ